LPEVARAADADAGGAAARASTRPRLSSTARLVRPRPSLPCLSPRLAQTVEFRAAVTFEGGTGGVPAGYVPGSAVTTRGSTRQVSLTFGAAATFRGYTGAAAGGGLYLTSASATFNGPVVFDSNTASGDGGGVYCSAANLTFNGPTTSFANNAAGGNGGALVMTTGCTAVFGGGATATFTANTAARCVFFRICLLRRPAVIGGRWGAAARSLAGDTAAIRSAGASRRAAHPCRRVCSVEGPRPLRPPPPSARDIEKNRSGGGIFADDGTLLLAGNTTLSRNRAGPSAAGLTGSGGGAFFANSAVLTCPAGASLAISGNTASFGAGVGAGAGGSTQTRPGQVGWVQTRAGATHVASPAAAAALCLAGPHMPLHTHPATAPAPGTCGTPAGGGLALLLNAAPACAITVTNNTAFSVGGGAGGGGGGGILLNGSSGPVLDFKNGLQQVCAGEGGSLPIW
jgi:predicted outer membrane repeat protein